MRLTNWRVIAAAVSLVVVGSLLAVRPARAAELMTAPSTLPWVLVIVLTGAAGVIAYTTSAATDGTE